MMSSMPACVSLSTLFTLVAAIAMMGRRFSLRNHQREGKQTELDGERKRRSDNAQWQCEAGETFALLLGTPLPHTQLKQTSREPNRERPHDIF